MAEADRLRAFGIDMFEDSGRDEEFFGFEDEEPEEGLVEGMDDREGDGGRLVEGGEEVGGQDVDFVVDVVDDGGRMEADPVVVMEAMEDTWVEKDGSAREVNGVERKVLVQLGWSCQGGGTEFAGGREEESSC